MTRGRPRPRAARPRRRGARAGVGCFVELHVEQGRRLVDSTRRSGWRPPSGRTAASGFTFSGEANHAGHHAPGGPPRPDADVRRHGARRAQKARPADARATFGRVEVEPERHQRDPLDGPGLAGRPRRGRGRRSRELVAAVDRGAHERADRDGTDGRGRRRVGLAGRQFRRRRCPAASRRRPGSPTRRRRSRDADRRPGTTRGCSPPTSRPRCCSSATPPASRTPPPSTPTSADCLAGVRGAGRGSSPAEVLEAAEP